MPDTLVNGRRIEYALAPPVRDGAPTIIFLHEGLGCVDAWRGFPGALAAFAGCGVLEYSRWGYGRSASRSDSWPASYMHDEAMATLPAIIARFSLDRPILYGHSDGGSIALIAAAHHPGLIRAVITEAAHVFVEHVSVDGVRRLRACYDTGDLRPRLARYHGSNTNAMVDGWTGAWLDPGFLSWNIRPLLPFVTCPVFAMQGEADEYGTGAQITGIAAGVGGPVETWILEACGHTPHRDQARAVVARSAAFIAKVAFPTPPAPSPPAGPA